MKHSYVFADRMEYSVFVLDIPAMGKKKRESAAKILLHSKYPMSLSDKRIILLANGKQKHSCLCFVCPFDYGEGDKASSTRYVLNRLRKYSGKACFIGSHFIEKLEIQEGALVTSKASVFEGGDEEIDSAYTVIREPPVQAIKKDDLFPAAGYGRVLKKLGIVAAIMLVLGSVGSGVAVRYTERARVEKEHRRLLEEAEKARKVQSAELKKQAEALRAEYQALLYAQNPDPYVIASLIYRCIGSGDKIENISIAGNTFQLDVHTKDGIAVLSNFEKHNLIEEIRMSRSAKEGTAEFVTYSGIVRKRNSVSDGDMDDEEAIAYYSEALAKDKKKRERMEREAVSEYAQRVRNLIEDAGCSEEYMQCKLNGGYAELECGIKCGSKAIFDFLKRAGAGEDAIECSSVRIRSYGEGVQATVRIYTGIKAESVRKEFAYSEEDIQRLGVMPIEIGKAFFSAPKSARVKPRIQTEQKAPAAIGEEKRGRITNRLRYIGEGGTKGKARYVFLKDERDGRMYRLPFKNIGESGDGCIDENGLLEVHLGGEIYEVRK